MRPTHTTDGGEVTTVKYSTVPTHDTRPRDHPNHYLGRVRPTGVDPFSLLGDTGPGGPERSNPLPTHPGPPPKHGFLDRSDLPSMRQLPVSWLSRHSRPLSASYRWVRSAEGARRTFRIRHRPLRVARSGRAEDDVLAEMVGGVSVGSKGRSRGAAVRKKLCHLDRRRRCARRTASKNRCR